MLNNLFRNFNYVCTSLRWNIVCQLVMFRFRALDRMEDDRKAILLNHLGFIQRAYRECCPFHDHCVDNLLEQTLNAHSRRFVHLIS